jgi:Zn-finger nucleic acid-binding protein
MSDRQGVEIDYCPQCRGVWLDRGELDKLIDRSVSALPASSPQPIAQQPQQQFQPQRSDYKDSGYNQSGQYGQRKPKSWLSEIFD